MHEEGFEPSHLTIVGLKSTALDHSAIRALVGCPTLLHNVYSLYSFCLSFYR